MTKTQENTDWIICAIFFGLILLAFLLIVFIPVPDVRQRNFDNQRFRDVDVGSKRVNWDNQLKKDAFEQKTDALHFIEKLSNGKMRKTYVYNRPTMEDVSNPTDSLSRKRSVEPVQNSNMQKENVHAQVGSQNNAILPSPSLKEILGLCYTIEPFPIRWLLNEATGYIIDPVTVDFSGLGAGQNFTEAQFLANLQTMFAFWNGVNPIYATNVTTTYTAQDPTIVVNLIQFGTYPFGHYPEALALTSTVWTCVTALVGGNCPNNNFQMSDFYMVFQTNNFIFGDASKNANVYDLQSILNHEGGHSIGANGDTYDYECQMDIMYGLLYMGQTYKRILTPSVINSKKALGYIDTRNPANTAFGGLSVNNANKNDEVAWVMITIIVAAIMLK